MVVGVSFRRLALIGTVNLLGVLALLALAEAVSYGVLRLRDQPAARTEWSEGYALNDSLLGKRRPPMDIATVTRRSADGGIIYQQTETSDSLGWRVVPGAVPRSRFVAFFGGSYTYGLGIGDDEHLAARFAQIQERYRPHSLSFGGWGPSHFLALIESQTPLGIEADTGVAVFTYIPAHADRVQGPFHIAAPGRWAQHHPLYEPEGDSMVYKGSMLTGRPTKARLFGLLASLHTVKLLAPNATFVEQDPSLASRVLSQACRRFAERFVSLGCFVVLYPNRTDHELPPGEFELIDLRGLYDPSNPAMAAMPGVDSHPTAAAIRLYADTLAALLP